MKKYITVISLLVSTLIAFPQKCKNQLSQCSDDVYQMMELDSMPKFRGGYDSLMTYIDRNLIYPSVYADASIQGKIICNFILTECGKIVKVKVIQGIDKPLDNSVKELLYSMPSWLPGKKGGKSVKVEMFLPIFCSVK